MLVRAECVELQCADCICVASNVKMQLGRRDARCSCCGGARLGEIQGPLSSLIAARGEGAPCKSTDPRALHSLAGCILTRMTHIFHRYTPPAQWACYRVLLCTYTHPVCTCHEPLTQRKIKQRRHATLSRSLGRSLGWEQAGLHCFAGCGRGAAGGARHPTGSPACK